VSTNVFQDALVKVGITNGKQLAERLECPAVILFFAGPKVAMPYAELRYWDDQGREKSSRHEPNFRDASISSMRRKTVQEAQDKAKEVLGLEEWAKSPFPNCWLPTEVLQAARARYMEPVQQG
jgi:hypothetical protein